MWSAHTFYMNAGKKSKRHKQISVNSFKYYPTVFVMAYELVLNWPTKYSWYPGIYQRVKSWPPCHPIFIISSVKRSKIQEILPERHINMSDFIKYSPDLSQISRHWKPRLQYIGSFKNCFFWLSVRCDIICLHLRCL